MKLHNNFFSSLVAVLLCLVAAGTRASNVPAGFTETVVPGPFAGLWGKPVGTTFDPSGRMFVWERLGRIWVKGPTETNFTQLLSIEEEQGDEGLLGFAIDPDFQANGYIYLFYVVDRHYLFNFGTTNYNPAFSVSHEATIGRLTRYTCVASNDFKSVNPASRLVLLGESKTNGLPICFSTHTLGSLVFGQDGTLLLTTGDTSSFSEVDLGGSASGSSFAPQATNDGILRIKEDVGAYRAQLVDCLSGKVLRLDPATGNGLPSNPYYDPANPRAAKSRVWALGFRNPFRATLRPNSGSHNPADGNPGALYVGDVGWDTKESLKVVTKPGQNFGWPLYEGLSLTPDRGAASYNSDVANRDAPNPLYPGSGCSQYFSFRQLLKPASTNAAGQPPFNNPCNASVKISTNIPQFLQHRAALDWEHSSAITHTPTYDSSGNATLADVGASGSPVSGAQFQGNCSVAGAWYDGNVFPAAYTNKYFHADWGQQVIKLFTFNTNNQPAAVGTFATSVGPVVSIVKHPFDGSLYYVLYDGDTGTVWQLAYTGNRTPVAVIAASQTYGPGPLTNQFNGSGSSDPDGQAITYSWNFGDGTAVSTAANPSHVFTSPGNIRTNYVVTLTVTDTGGLSASATLNIALNDTPPNVTISSPTNGALYSPSSITPFSLTATVSDLESSDSQLQYQWQTILHHNDHNHVEDISTNHVSSTLIEPVGCDGINIYYYRIVLTVTDPNGLATVREVRLFPNCGTTDTPPTISDVVNQSTAINQPAGPLAFTIGDTQVAAANLQLSAGSSNPTLVPTNNIVFGGFSSNRTVTVTPAASATGTSTITLTVNDGPNNTSDTFVLTVSGSNSPPVISALANQSTTDGTPTAANPFTVSDANTPAGSLTVSGSAANATLVPPGNIAFGGSGSNRTVTVTPAAGQSGVTAVTVVVSDGQLSASNSFTLTITSIPTSTKSVTNATSITINDSGAATPYPSTINVSSMIGTLSNVTVTLRNLTHTWGADVDVLLVGPAGQKVMLMSDCGSGAASDVTLTLSDAAAAALPAANLTLGTFRPTDLSDGSTGGDSFPAPAPASPFGSALTNFNGTAPNGTWSLYVFDDGPGDAGNLAGGWSLTLVTQGGAISNNTPTISAISNQVTAVNTPTAALPFTISDTETAAASLTLGRASSNTNLVPVNNIVFGGSGSNRTVTVTPATGQTGTSTITVTVSDGTNSAASAFLLTVNVVNTPPTIGGIPDQTISEDNSTGPIAFTIGDAETAPGSLTLSRDSSDLTLVPTNNIVFGGSGSNRTVTVTPATNQSGSSTITVTVGDGQYSASTNFVVTVNPVDDAPVISAIADQSILTNTSTAALAFTLSDVDTPVGSLTLSNASSNPTLVPTNNIVFGGSGSNRTVTVTPDTDQSGTATITVFVSDGTNTTSDAFVVTVFAIQTQTQAFTNATAITILDNTAGSPYPSSINVTGLTGVVNSVTVTLRSLSHQWGRDMDILLLGPGGRNVMVLSDAGTTPTATNTTFTFSDSAAGFLPQTGSLAGGTYRPTDYEPGDVMPAPALTGPYATNLAAFIGQNPNGAWSLFVVDDGTGDTGSIAGGWSVTITTQPGTASNTPPVISAISNRVTVINTATAAIPFTIFDWETAPSNLVLTVFSSNAALVPTNQIVIGGSGGSRTVTVTPTSNQLGSATISLTVSDGTFTASNSFVLTVNLAPLTVTENSASRSYGVTNPVLSGSVAGLQAGDSITANFTTTANTNSPAGAYAIAFTLSDPGGRLVNYVVTTNNGTLTVTNAPLRVTANSTNKIYGGARTFAGTEFALTSGTLFNGNTLTNVVLTSAGAGTNAAAGSYPITATSAAGLGLTNYTISYSNGTLTVANALLTVTAKSTNKIYGSARTFAGTEFTLTSGTLFNGNTLTNVTLTSVGAGTNATIGSYPINASAAAGPGLTNYTVSYVTGTLTVTNAPLTVTANSTNKVYGGAQTFAGNEFTLTGGTLFNGNTLTNVTLASAGAGTNAVTGGYPITVTNAAGLGLTNYTISYSNGMLTVANALLTVMANSTNKIYGSTRTFAGTEFTITGGTLFNGNTLTNVALASAGSVSNAAVGSYAITVTNALGAGLTNYLVGYSDGTLTVGSASLLITALDTNKNFGDVLIFGGVEFVVAGLLNADVVSSAALASDGAMAGAAAGNYPVTITNALGAGLGNYSIAYLPGTLQVTSASQPFLITALVVSNGLAMITWSAVSNESYRLMFTDELAGTNWNELAPDVLATGTNATATNSVDGVEQRFYRVWRP